MDSIHGYDIVEGEVGEDAWGAVVGEDVHPKTKLLEEPHEMDDAVTTVPNALGTFGRRGFDPEDNVEERLAMNSGVGRKTFQDFISGFCCRS